MTHTHHIPNLMIGLLSFLLNPLDTTVFSTLVVKHCSGHRHHLLRPPLLSG